MRRPNSSKRRSPIVHSSPCCPVCEMVSIPVMIFRYPSARDNKIRPAVTKKLRSSGAMALRWGRAQQQTFGSDQPGTICELFGRTERDVHGGVHQETIDEREQDARFPRRVEVGAKVALGHGLPNRRGGRLEKLGADHRGARERARITHHLDAEVHQATEVLGTLLTPAGRRSDLSLEAFARGRARGLLDLERCPIAGDGREGEGDDLFLRS